MPLFHRASHAVTIPRPAPLGTTAAFALGDPSAGFQDGLATLRLSLDGLMAQEIHP